MPLIPGTILGQYEIRSPLGAGGMGEVYRAHDTRLDREVAIKVLPESLTSDPERLRRFEQEARAAAALNHPNILAVYQMATHESVSYMVSELLDGETLRERLRRGPVPMRKAIDYAVQIAHGLAAAHDRGITHRDLKPENLFVTKDGRVKILDFGLAKVGPSKDSLGEEVTLASGTDPGMVMGTVGYMSPEQVRGKTADHRSDIFAFGTVLYEMVTGKQTFRKPTSAETMTAILKEEPPSISQIAPASPPGLQRVVHRCLEKSPEQRFQSASDMAFALEALSDSGSSPVAVIEQRSRSRWAWVAGAGVLAALAAGLVAWWTIPPAVPVVEPLPSSPMMVNQRKATFLVMDRESISTKGKPGVGKSRRSPLRVGLLV
jgi:serine/threonine protein kinase